MKRYEFVQEWDNVKNMKVRAVTNKSSDVFYCDWFILEDDIVMLYKEHTHIGDVHYKNIRMVR